LWQDQGYDGLHRTGDPPVKQLMHFKINGKDYELAVEPNRTLLEVLTEELGLTGTKMGCNEGDCGACTVIVDGRAVCSCLILAIEAQNKTIENIEALALNGQLHPLQQAFIDYGAIQCGYCTPGMIMSAKALLDKNPDPTETDIRRALQGNLCRCTGYVKIVEAVMAAREVMKGFSSIKKS
jgi:carbon-monoxide dehydrogenase small subunit